MGIAVTSRLLFWILNGIIILVIGLIIICNIEINRRLVGTIGSSRTPTPLAVGKQKQKRMLSSYSLYNNQPYNCSPVKEMYSCFNDTNRVPLRGIDKDNTKGRTFNFTARISTSLNIFVVGDSVALQLAQYLQIACGTRNVTILHNERNRYGDELDMVTVSTDIDGGGAVAFWRSSGMMLPAWTSKEESDKQQMRERRKQMRQQRKKQRRQGQSKPDTELDQLQPSMEHLFTALNTEVRTGYSRVGLVGGKATAATEPEEDIINAKVFNVLINRISHPWIDFNDVTVENLNRILEDASRHLGVQTVIFTTMPFNNNVVTFRDLDRRDEKNNLLRSFASNFRPSATDKTTVQNVFVADIAKFLDAVVERNARHNLGLLNTSLSSPKLHWLVESKQCKPGYNYHSRKNYSTAIAHVCGEMPAIGEDECSCRPNAITYDGIHICMNTLGARINANFACLIGCIDDTIDTTQKAACADECNEVFMSMKPIGQTHQIHGD